MGTQREDRHTVSADRLLSSLKRGQTKMKWSLLLAFLLVLVGVVSGQKGGAKGAMRGNRGKGGGSRGGRGRGGGREGGGGVGPGGTMGEDVPWNERPCVGLCYLRKLANLPRLKDPSLGKKRCVGMCYRSRLRGREDQWRKKEERVQAIAKASQVNGKPCIGLCYTEKLKAEKVRKMAEKENKV